MTKKLQRLFWFCLILLSPVIPLEAYFAGNWYSILHSYSLAMFFGIISYVWFANALILSGRLPFLDRVFGQDRVIIFHGYLAAGALVCGCTHAILKSMYFDDLTVQIILGSTAFITFALVAVVTIMFMLRSKIHNIHFIDSMRNFCVKRLGFDYSRLKLFHNLTALALLLIIIHVILASPTSETTYRLFLTGAWGIISILVYTYHKIIRFFWCRRNALTVESVDMLSENIIMVSSDHGKSRSTHRAGQFGYFRLMSPACGIEEHPFTIASSPKSKSLGIVIKSLGNYTSKLQKVTSGSKLLFDGPYGTFTPKLNAHSYIFIAGGIGITPFLSILSEWSDVEIKKPLTLIWSVKNKADLIFQDLIESLNREQKYFNYVNVLTSEDEGDSKHINLELISENLPTDDLKDMHAYLCGPFTLRKDTARWLKQLGLSRSNIHYESFGN